MRSINQNSNVPVFYHVPKNAGTFAVSLIFIYLRFFRWHTLHGFKLPGEPNRNIVIKKNNLEVARIIGYDPNMYCNSADDFVIGDPNDDTYYYIDIEKITNEHLDSFNVFTIILEADGFLHHTQILSKFQKYNLKKFIILRDPIKRMISFFNYINSDSAKHEPTYGIIPNNLSEYVNSHFLEDSWLIRQFANVSDNEGINDNHYDITYNELKHFDVADISNTENLIKNIYANYLNIIVSDEELARCVPKRELPNIKNSLSNDLVSNQSKKDNNDLSEQDLQVVNERIKYEIKLYNNLVKC